MSVDLEYYRRRERQERESAERSEDKGPRRIHTEMADRYRELMKKMGQMPPAAQAATHA